MHIQPNSEPLRKYIPVQEYFQLMETQRINSYIGLSLSTMTEEYIVQRIGVLEAMEVSGFVFLGEKNWLQDYMNGHDQTELDNYDQWVSKVFEEMLGLSFEISDEFDHLPQTVWRAELNAENLLLDFPELKNPAFLPVDELEIFVTGNEKAPAPAYLIKAFEFLHNLEYAISTVPYLPKDGREISVTGIDVTNPLDPCRWELNVISDYGSDWDFTIVNGQAWRAK